MKIKTSEATPMQLNWLVAQCEFPEPDYDDEWRLANISPEGNEWAFQPSTDWEQGGPIIEREWLDITAWPNESDEDMRWHCQQHDSTVECGQYGPTPLIAAMRCYVVSKLGSEVEISDELDEKG